MHHEERDVTVTVRRAPPIAHRPRTRQSHHSITTSTSSGGIASTGPVLIAAGSTLTWPRERDAKSRADDIRHR
jgi:hypothetical protein